MDLDENRLNPKGVYTDDFPAEILQQGPGSIAKTSPNATFTPIISGNDIDIGFDIELINSYNKFKDITDELKKYGVGFNYTLDELYKRQTKHIKDHYRLKNKNS